MNEDLCAPSRNTRGVDGKVDYSHVQIAWVNTARCHSGSLQPIGAGATVKAGCGRNAAIDVGGADPHARIHL